MTFSPYWNSWSDFIHMGGYALYVWCSLGMAMLIFFFEPLVLICKKRKIMQKIAVFWSNDSEKKHSSTVEK